VLAHNRFLIFDSIRFALFAADQPPPYAGVQQEAYPKQSPYNPGY